MARAASGAGAVAAPNNSLAIGLGLGGFFLAVGLAAGFGGAGVATVCGAGPWAAAPQKITKVRPTISLRMALDPFA